MDSLQEYALPIDGLRLGVHEFGFKVDRSFFEAFENSAIGESNFEVQLTLEKRPNLFVLNFYIQGTIQTECDRCLEVFDLPIEGSHELLVKYAAEASEEMEVIYIQPETRVLNVARFVYEFIHLTVPMVKNHDASGGECDPDILNILEGQDYSDEPESDEPNPIWEALRRDFGSN